MPIGRPPTLQGAIQHLVQAEIRAQLLEPLRQLSQPRQRAKHYKKKEVEKKEVAVERVTARRRAS